MDYTFGMPFSWFQETFALVYPLFNWIQNLVLNGLASYFLAAGTKLVIRLRQKQREKNHKSVKEVRKTIRLSAYIILMSAKNWIILLLSTLRGRCLR
jgi:hypothetical protein